MKVDRASMACSLEVRAPFLDVELVEFLGRVPSRLKLRRFGHEAPAEARDGRTCSRRASPSGRRRASASRSQSGSRRSLREALQDELSPARIRDQGIFEPAACQRLISEHMTGRRDHRKPLWTLFVFQLWHRRWIERRNSATVSARA